MLDQIENFTAAAGLVVGVFVSLALLNSWALRILTVVLVAAAIAFAYADGGVVQVVTAIKLAVEHFEKNREFYTGVLLGKFAVAMIAAWPASTRGQ